MLRFDRNEFDISILFFQNVRNINASKLGIASQCVTPRKGSANGNYDHRL